MGLIHRPSVDWVKPDTKRCKTLRTSPRSYVELKSSSQAKRLPTSFVVASSTVIRFLFQFAEAKEFGVLDFFLKLYEMWLDLNNSFSSINEITSGRSNLVQWKNLGRLPLLK